MRTIYRKLYSLKIDNYPYNSIFWGDNLKLNVMIDI